MTMRVRRALYSLPLLALVVVWDATHGEAASPQALAEAGKYKTEIRQFTVNLRSARTEVARELARAESDMNRCAALLALPDRRKLLVIDAVFNHVLLSALRRPFAVFATRLRAIAPNGASLADGPRAWTETAKLVVEYPAPRLPLCASVRKWVKSHFAPTAAPVDVPRIRATARRYAKLERRLTRVARRLRELGLSAATARAFTVEAAIAIALDEASRKPR